MSVGRPALPRRLLATEIGLLALAILLLLPREDAVLPVMLGIPVLVYGWLGARIAERASRSPVGWLLSAAAVTGAMGLATLAYTSFGRVRGTAPLPATEAIDVVNSVVPLPLIGVSLLLAFMYFPTGTLPSTRWWPAPWVVVVSGLLAVATILSHQLRGHAAALEQVFVAMAGLSSVVTVGALAIRSRRGTREERAPIRGLLVTLLVMAIAFAVIVARASQVEWDVWIFVAGIVIVVGALGAIPFSLSVAMLRYGLFEYEVGVRKRIAAWVLAGMMVAASALVLFVLFSAVVGAAFTSGGGGGGPDPMVGVVTGVIAGIALMIAWRFARRFAERVVFHDRATPYEVLSQFSERIGETYSLDDVLPRMTRLLGRGTGAAVATTWVVVGGELRAISSFPDDAPPPRLQVSGGEPRTDDPSTHVYAVTHRSRLLGALSLTMSTNDPMNPSKERLIRDLANQAALVLQNVALLEDVRESRRRIVAAQDERARALERNIHDGAQQQLVALTVKLRLAEQLVDRDPSATKETLHALQADVASALEDLRDLARGIYPPLLADQGLRAALEAQARKAAIPVVVEADGVGRYQPEVEAVVYFSCLEALNNTAKYAGATSAVVRLEQSDGMLGFSIADDGQGFDPERVRRGTGLQGIEDRVEAIGGRLEILSTPGEGTSVKAVVPLERRPGSVGQPDLAADQASSSRSGPNADLGM